MYVIGRGVGWGVKLTRKSEGDLSRDAQNVIYKMEKKKERKK